MKKILRILFFSGLLLPAAAHSQAVNDAQLWENIYLENNLTKKMVIHLNHEGRLTDNMTRFNYGYLDLGVTQKVRKWFRVSADYVFVRKKYYDNYIANRHQVYFSGTFRGKFGDFSVSDRNMVQWEWQNPYTSPEGKNSEAYYRNKVTVKYSERDLSPYFAMEHYFSLGYYGGYAPQLDRGRYYLGAFYRINTVNYLEGYFMMEHHMNVAEPENNWVIGIGYEHSFYSGIMGKW